MTDSMSIYFNASRDKEYDRGGEEILKYDRVSVNAGEALNPDNGVFTCPVSGTYLFMVHLATHKDKVKLKQILSDHCIIFLDYLESPVVIEKEWFGYGQYSQSRW